MTARDDLDAYIAETAVSTAEAQGFPAEVADPGALSVAAQSAGEAFELGAQRGKRDGSAPTGTVRDAARRLQQNAKTSTGETGPDAA
jgi:hypothetical protein